MPIITASFTTLGVFIENSFDLESDRCRSLASAWRSAAFLGNYSPEQRLALRSADAAQAAKSTVANDHFALTGHPSRCVHIRACRGAREFVKRQRPDKSMPLRTYRFAEDA